MRTAIVDFMRDFARDPLRQILTLFGIVLGTGSIVFLASMLSSASLALARLDQNASGDDLSRVEVENPRGALSASRTTRPLSVHDVEPLQKFAQLNAQQIGASTTLYHQEATWQGKRMFVGVQSGGTKFAKLSNLEILKGRWVAPEEEAHRLCVIGYDIWQTLFGGKWPIPQPTFVLNGASSLTVVGVLKPRPPAGGGGDGTWSFDRKVWISNEVLDRSIQMTSGDAMEIGMRHELLEDALPDLKLLAQKMTPLLANLHLGVRNFEFDALNKGFQTWQLITFALGAVMFASGLVAMVVGGVNVMNAQLVTLAEKTKEYGIRRALGASARTLRNSVLLDSSLLTLSGGIIGALFGLGLAWGLSQLLTAVWTPWPFLPTWWAVAVALGSSALVGIVAGLLPAVRAARLVPSACLRSD